MLQYPVLVSPRGGRIGDRPGDLGDRFCRPLSFDPGGIVQGSPLAGAHLREGELGSIGPPPGDPSRRDMLSTLSV